MERRGRKGEEGEAAIVSKARAVLVPTATTRRARATARTASGGISMYSAVSGRVREARPLSKRKVAGPI
jgi:hypothetical protein